MEAGSTFSSGSESGIQGDNWYVDNYILLKDYYDRTISRIAARCVRQGNIAMEEYAHYGYILDVLEEISETGDYILEHRDLYPYVEKKIAGGIKTLEKTLNEFKTELKNNASPDMIKQDKDELEKIKDALGAVDKSVDPTVGAGMSMDEVVEKLMNKQNNEAAETARQASQAEAAPSSSQGTQPRPQAQQPQSQAGQQPRPAQANNQPQRTAQNPGQVQRPQGNQAPRPQGQGQASGNQRPQGQAPQQQRPAQGNSQPQRTTQNPGQAQRPQGNQAPRPQGQGQSAGKQQAPGQTNQNNPAAGTPTNKGSN